MSSLGFTTCGIRRCGDGAMSHDVAIIKKAHVKRARLGLALLSIATVLAAWHELDARLFYPEIQAKLGMRSGPHWYLPWFAGPISQIGTVVLTLVGFVALICSASDCRLRRLGLVALLPMLIPFAWWSFGAFERTYEHFARHPIAMPAPLPGVYWILAHPLAMIAGTVLCLTFAWRFDATTSARLLGSRRIWVLITLIVMTWLLLITIRTFFYGGDGKWYGLWTTRPVLNGRFFGFFRDDARNYYYPLAALMLIIVRCWLAVELWLARSRINIAADLCPHCGYDRRLSATPFCPECGTEIHVQEFNESGTTATC
jgi:hypothetical protein